MTSIIQKVEADVEAFAEEMWTALKPGITGLGATILGQIETAAETFIATGGNFADALDSVVAQLPADVKALESVVAGALAGVIAAKQAAAAPAPAAPAAS